MSIWRGVMLCLMIGTTLFAWYADIQAFSDFYHSSSATSAVTFKKIDFNYLYLVLPLVCYALIFHPSVPTLSQAIQDKHNLANIFAIGMIICVFFYVAVGASVALYFGEYVFQSSNINWKNYVGDVESSSTAVSILSKFISIVVVFFPAFDVVSIYPLYTIALANNLMSTYYGSSDVHDQETSRWTRSIFRLVAGVPPILVSFCVRDLSAINGYTGTTGFFIAFLFPPLLAYYSGKYLRERDVDPTTVYSSKIWTGFGMQMFMIVLSIFLATYTLYVMITIES
jgi:hypothetical protein